MSSRPTRPVAVQKWMDRFELLVHNRALNEIRHLITRVQKALPIREGIVQLIEGWRISKRCPRKLTS